MSGVSLDLSALVRNWLFLKERSAPAICGAVVKANAYGLGAPAVVSALYEAGCRLFFTAKTKEALPLKKLAPEAGFVVLHGVYQDEAAEALAAKLISVINTPEQLFWPAAFWLGVDTGMSRLGFRADDLPNLQGRKPEVIMSHLAVADEPQHFMNVEQLKAFRSVARLFPESQTSLSASSGIFLGGAYLGHITRPGYALYGGNPTPDSKNPMEPVVFWRGNVLQTRIVKEGETAGYGAVWAAHRPTRLAIVEVGYAQGLRRSVTNSGGVVIFDGVRLPIVGRVSMDLLQVDVTDLPPDALSVGSCVDILGRDQTVDDLARAAGTIGYEILTSLPAQET